MSVLPLFQKIVAQLEAAGAPPGWLRPGVSADQIEAAETKMGVRLPEEWRELYLYRDGESLPLGLILGMPWISLEEMMLLWQSWKDLEPEYSEMGTHYSLPQRAIVERYVNPGWLAVSLDHGGNHLGIDMAPGPSGTPGQIINFGRDEDVKYVISSHLEPLLRFMLAEIDGGRLQLNRAKEASPLLEWRGGLHFLDGIKSLELPLGESVARAARPADLEAWRASFAPPWPGLLAKPEAFLDAKIHHLIRKGLGDLEPLRWCSSLVGLFIAANDVSDLTPLSQLENLKTLHALGNPIEDLTPLAGIASLRILHLDKTPIRDLGPLALLPDLQELHLMDMPVFDLGPLSQIRGLRRLELSPRGISLEPLAGLGQLSFLHLDGADDSCVREVARMQSLRELVIRPLASDLSPLSALTKLKSLTLVGAQDLDAGFLAELGHLEELTLKDCRLENLDALRGHPKLRTFTSDGSEIGDVLGLQECSALTVVTGSYREFLVLKPTLPKTVSFPSIIGNMTTEERENWLRLLAVE